MWDDVIIGKGRTSGSAIKVFKISGDHGISENRKEYWISELFLNCSMTISKDSDEGETLKTMIDREDTLESILDYLNRILLKFINQDKLRMRIDEAIKSAYQEGSRDRVQIIRESLGIR